MTFQGARLGLGVQPFLLSIISQPSRHIDISSSCHGKYGSISLGRVGQLQISDDKTSIIQMNKMLYTTNDNLTLQLSLLTRAK
jgi:hypothetical protein